MFKFKDKMRDNNAYWGIITFYFIMLRWSLPDPLCAASVLVK
jgi:hypothetical protein